ncbi:hypothetical protein SCD_n02677 [Sulfuricella denitrificans skB26]|uniref:Uncharacterized protein n=1 Tax=Sulfuricella denitrificans (strain DSM 22764 / NBRC 105220 / skB26) TaxID=1163617 RepID=S6B7R7_SULDS|nr:hypothetical protein [Sulfuricella denitrificans]BAN36477.1 hypothetical protein SCD_n02677 [Sulfuricella denitrificans skB26]
MLITVAAVTQAGEEATSVKVPKFVAPVTPAIVAVPVLVILPLANGELAVGRTRMFCQVNEFVLELAAVTVKVICVAVTVGAGAAAVPVGVSLMFLVLVLLPVTTTLTAAAVSNSKPLGALRMMVPVETSPELASSYTGPLNDVQVPAALHPGAVFEGIALPPVEAVTVPAFAIPPKMQLATKIRSKPTQVAWAYLRP